MYAIIEAGGQQFKVEEGQELQIDLQDVAPGETITFDQVLAVSGDDGIEVGRPTLASSSVTAKVVGNTQGPKLTVQKFRRRKNFKSKTGHRQLYTLVKIEKINVA